MRVLFCGFRHSHINGLYQKLACSDTAEIVGCVEEDAAARRAAEQELGAVFTDRSYEDWLSSDEVDVVAVGTAYGHRGETVIKALRAGKHVIADKPICTDLEQLEEIRRLCNEGKGKLSCMLDLRYLPQTLQAKRILSDGRLGAVCNVSFNGQHPLNYGKRPAWYFEKGMHGGTINDIAIHGVDLVRMLTGEEFVSTDAARMWNSYAKAEPHFLDCATIMARLESGAGVMADVSYSAPSQAFSLPSYWEFRFWCERGMLVFNYPERAVTVYEEGVAEPIRYDCPEEPIGYWQELLEEIHTNGTAVTENVLRSTETVLRIQACATVG